MQTDRTATGLHPLLASRWTGIIAADLNGILEWWEETGHPTLDRLGSGTHSNGTRRYDNSRATARTIPRPLVTYVS